MIDDTWIEFVSECQAAFKNRTKGSPFVLLVPEIVEGGSCGTVKFISHELTSDHLPIIAVHLIELLARHHQDSEKIQELKQHVNQLIGRIDIIDVDKFN